MSKHRDTEQGPDAAEFYGFGPSVFRISERIENMDRVTLECCAPDERAATGRDGIVLHELPILLREPVAGGQVISLALAAEQKRAIGVAEPRCGLHKIVKHGLKIERRA